MWEKKLDEVNSALCRIKNIDNAIQEYQSMLNEVSKQILSPIQLSSFESISSSVIGAIQHINEKGDKDDTFTIPDITSPESIETVALIQRAHMSAIEDMDGSIASHTV
jgi:hypothetical protein